MAKRDKGTAQQAITFALDLSPYNCFEFLEAWNNDALGEDFEEYFECLASQRVRMVA